MRQSVIRFAIYPETELLKLHLLFQGNRNSATSRYEKPLKIHPLDVAKKYVERIPHLMQQHKAGYGEILSYTDLINTITIVEVFKGSRAFRDLNLAATRARIYHHTALLATWKTVLNCQFHPKDTAKDQQQQAADGITTGDIS